jgi:hypothetical protein
MVASVVERPTELLVSSLARVAASPEQSAQFYELLRPYCHQARNVLNSLNMVLYLCRRSGEPALVSRLESVEGLYGDVERFIDRLHHFLRPPPLTLVRSSIGLLIEQHAESWSKRLAARGRRLIIAPPSEAAVAQFDLSLFERGFGDLVSWRASIGPARTDLRVSWKVVDGRLRVDWEEVGHRRKVGQEGGVESEGLEPLTVPLLTRIVSIHGGSLKHTDRPRWRLGMSWPVDVPVSARDSS